MLSFLVCALLLQLPSVAYRKYITDATNICRASGALEFYAFNTRLPEMTMLASKDFTAAKKVNSNRARPDITCTECRFNAYPSALDS